MYSTVVCVQSPHCRKMIPSFLENNIDCRTEERSQRIGFEAEGSLLKRRSQKHKNQDPSLHYFHKEITQSHLKSNTLRTGDCVPHLSFPCSIIMENAIVEHICLGGYVEQSDKSIALSKVAELDAIDEINKMASQESNEQRLLCTIGSHERK